MSQEMEEGRGDDAASALPGNPPDVATVNTQQELENLTADLQIKLHIANSKLREEQNNLLQMRLQQESDILESREVQRLIQGHQNQVTCLKETINSTGKIPLLRSIEENKKLCHRNNILVYTNTSLVSQLHTSETEKNKLNDELASLRSCSRMEEVLPQPCHPGGDAECTLGGNSPEMEEGEVCESTKDKSVYISELKTYLADYCKLLFKSQVEKQHFEKQASQYHCTIVALEEKIMKFTEQIQVVVQERDQLQTMLHTVKQESKSSIRHPVDQSTSSSANAQEYEINQSTSTSYNHQQLSEHYKNLVVEVQEENKILQYKLSNKEDHILEQESKIEKLIIQFNDAERERDAARSLISDQREEIQRLQHDIQKNNKDIAEKTETIGEYLSQLDTTQSKNQTMESTFAYEEQIKAFQDDYFAELEEKQKIMKEKELLQRANDNLRLELGNRNIQNQFSSPPPGPNPTFDSMLRPAPTEYSGMHQQHHIPSSNSGTLLESLPPRPNLGHGLRLPEYSTMQPGPASHPHQGTIPNSGIQVYQTRIRYVGHSNTIPPRNSSENHMYEGQYNYYGPNVPVSPPTDQQAYYMSSQPNYPPPDHRAMYANQYVTGTPRMVRPGHQGPSPPHNTQNRQTP